MGLKQTEPKEVTIGADTFYIRPISAFKAANLTAELANVFMPILTALASFVGEKKEDGTDMDLTDIDITKHASEISGAFSGIDGDKVESLLKKLLIKSGNIAVEYSENDEEKVPTKLTEDIANEIFCEEVQNMFLLAFEVIRLNYNGFFKKAADLFGSQKPVTAKTKRPVL